VIDFPALRRLSASIHVGYDDFGRCWQVWIVRDGHPTIEAADEDAQAAVSEAMRRLVAVGS